MHLASKSILLTLISTTIISSGEPTPAPVRVITFDKIEQRDDVYYEVGQATPFTGIVQDMYPNGKKSFKGNFKDGEQHGVTTWWYDDGKKERETNYKDGEWHGVETSWYENGKITSEIRYENGVKKD
jgi:antitoxin component YwqK of YwqJK toxin-antitoxin module